MPFGVVRLTERNRGRVALSGSVLAFVSITLFFFVLLNIAIFILPSPGMKLLHMSREQHMLNFMIFVGVLGFLVQIASLTFTLDNWTLGTRWVDRFPVLLLQGSVIATILFSLIAVFVSVHLYNSFGPDLKEEFVETMKELGKELGQQPSQELLERMDAIHWIQMDYDCCGFDPKDGLKEWFCQGNEPKYVLSQYSTQISSIATSEKDESWNCRLIDNVPSCFLPFSCCNAGSAKCLPSVLLEQHGWNRTGVSVGMGNMFTKEGCQEHVSRPGSVLALIVVFILNSLLQVGLLILIRLLETSCRVALEMSMPEEPTPGWLFSKGTIEGKVKMVEPYRETARRAGVYGRVTNSPTEHADNIKFQARQRQIRRHNKFWRGLLEHVNDDVPSIYMDDISYSSDSDTEPENKATESNNQ